MGDFKFTFDDIRINMKKNYIATSEKINFFNFKRLSREIGVIDLKRFSREIGVIDQETSNGIYTFKFTDNKQSRSSKLDKIVFSKDFKSQFSPIDSDILCNIISDHHPMMLQLYEKNR